MSSRMVLSKVTKEYYPIWAMREEIIKFDFPQHVDAVTLELMNQPEGERLKNLMDIRSIHRSLFSRAVPPRGEIYAGNFRGTPDTFLADYRSVVRVGPKSRNVNNPTTPPQKVASEVSRINAELEEILKSNDEIVVYYLRCIRWFADFSLIHPFVDGNGHVSRLVMLMLMKNRGIHVRPTWTVHPRPYSGAITYCITQYRKYPDVLALYLTKWFGGGLDANLKLCNSAGLADDRR